MLRAHSGTQVPTRGGRSAFLAASLKFRGYSDNGTARQGAQGRGHAGRRVRIAHRQSRTSRVGGAGRSGSRVRLRIFAKASRAVSSASGRACKYFGVVTIEECPSLLYDLEVGAAGQQPRGVRVTEVVHARPESEVGSAAGWSPDVDAEPVARDVLVGLGDARRARPVGALGPALGAVAGEGGPAVVAAALARRVRAEGGVPVAAVLLVRLGEPERRRPCVLFPP